MIWVADHRLQPESSDSFGFAGVLVSGPDILAVSHHAHLMLKAQECAKDIRVERSCVRLRSLLDQD